MEQLQLRQPPHRRQQLQPEQLQSQQPQLEQPEQQQPEQLQSEQPQNQQPPKEGRASIFFSILGLDILASAGIFIILYSINMGLIFISVGFNNTTLGNFISLVVYGFPTVVFVAGVIYASYETARDDSKPKDE